MDPETARQSGGDSAPASTENKSTENKPSEKAPPEKELSEEASSSKEVLSEDEERRHLKRFVRRRKKIVRALARKRPVQ